MRLTYASPIYPLPPWEIEPLCDSPAFRATVTTGLVTGFFGLYHEAAFCQELFGINFLVLDFGLSDHFSLAPSLLTSQGKQSHVSRATAVVSHIAFDVLRLNGLDIAHALNMSPPAISRLAARGRTDPLAGEIEEALHRKE